MEQEVFEYDAHGRLKYHPSLHTKHGQPWTEEDLEYLCKFHGVEPLATLALALDRPETSIATKIRVLKREGKYEYYRNLSWYY